MANATATAVVMARVIVCDAAKKIENAMETLRLSFRRYMTSLEQ